jgi:hypothetical protein
MTGKIRVNNIVFEYWVNSGSTLTLFHKDTSSHHRDTYLYYIYPRKDWRKYFLSGEDEPE